MFEKILKQIRINFQSEDFIPLHAPVFVGNEKKYLSECIDTTFVSYTGAFVGKFEEMVKTYTGSKYAVAMVNGTSALHLALHICGVERGNEVLTQALTFVATVNAITYTGAKPVFIDSEKTSLGMDPDKLEEFLHQETTMKDDGFCYNKTTGSRITACVPVHVFGHAFMVDKIKSICDRFNLILVEDAAESIGSYYKNQHTGTFGKAAILSFNGNKTITTGGGGMLLTNDADLAQKAKHLSTTAKIPHAYEFYHDQTAFNYRMPNVNAAIGCAQMECLNHFLLNKRELAHLYEAFFTETNIEFIKEPEQTKSNYWLNAIILKDRIERDEFLKYAIDNQVMCRPVWTLMNRLPMYERCQSTDLETASWLEDRVVNLPSSVRLFSR